MAVIMVDPLKQLDRMIGLEPVKKEIKKIISFRKLQMKRAEQGLPESKVSNHLVFTGNPGTGKTSVARVLARALHKLGVIGTDNLVEVDRGGLVASYVGQTAKKTLDVLNSALDGVLFIDEAYTLAGGSENDFGQEAVDTLLKFMEDNRSRIVVIVAGYEEEMRKFIDMNPGLQSRFTRYVHFPDYSAAELTEIFKISCKKSLYDCSDEVLAAVGRRMEEEVAQKPKNFSNGRFARNFFERVIECMSLRLDGKEEPTREELREIKLEDVENVSFDSAVASEKVKPPVIKESSASSVSATTPEVSRPRALYYAGERLAAVSSWKELFGALFAKFAELKPEAFEKLPDEPSFARYFVRVEPGRRYVGYYPLKKGALTRVRAKEVSGKNYWTSESSYVRRLFVHLGLKFSDFSIET